MGKLTNYYPAKNWKNKEAGYEYRYDFLERLEDSISPLGEHKRVFRNFEGNITKEIHPVSYQEQKENGEGTCYEYDKDGNCIRIHYPDGGTERRFYDADGNLLRQILPESYQSETDNGTGYSYIYDKKNRLVSICDPDGKELHHYEYNGHDQVIRDIDGEGKEILSGYDGLGQKIWEKISIRKENEETFYRMIAYHYDKQGNKIEEAYGNEAVTKEQTPFTWHSIYFSYDKNNHLIQVKDDDGAKVRYDYDCLGNRTLEEQTIAEGIQKRIHYRYNKNGWRIRKEEELQGNGEIRFAITSYEYDENGNLTKIRTPKGFEIQRTYDSNDRLITERVIDKKHGIDRTIILTYDATGNLIGETLQGAGLKALKRKYQYDFNDRLTHKTNTSGAITKYIYDKNNNLIKEIQPYGYNKEIDDGIGTIYSYDSRGNLIRETNGLGQVVTEHTYNLQDNPIRQTDGFGNQTEFQYTLDGQIKEVHRGTRAKPLQTYAYNARGQIVGIVDGNGSHISYQVDNWGKITEIGFADGVKEGYEYTPAGQVTKTRNGNGNSIQYLYNSMGKVRERMDQMGDTETFQYDEEGNLIFHMDRDGRQVSRTYNVLGNLVYEKATDKNGENPCLTTYQYDTMGRLVKAVCDGHSYEYTYNEQGYLKEKHSSGKRLISYEYDNVGQPIKITDPMGTETCYEYDTLGRTSRIYTNQGMEVKYGYDCLNRIETVQYGNGIETHYQYDTEGNVGSLETKLGETTFLAFQYEYDGNGNRLSKTGKQVLVDGTESHLNLSYQYNVRGQLLKEKRNENVCCYTYDATGNRLSKESKEGKYSYHYNQKNQLVLEESIFDKKEFTYNQQGSVLEEKASTGIRRFFYNSKNQQVRVEQANGQVQENYYDAEGLRYEMRENEKRFQFVYHRGELLYEHGNHEQTSYHLGAGIEAFQRNQQIYYYHQDEQLSTTFITDINGSIQNHYQYDAFGKELKKEEQLSNRIRYTGQPYDNVTEQYYLRARYYNPILGRFMQEDVYQGDGLNLYAYCDNNPVVYYDPSGYTEENASAICLNTGNAGNPGEGEKINGKDIESGSASNNILNKPLSEWTDEDIQRATDSIHNAQYAGKWYGVKNTIAVTISNDGMVVVSKNKGVPEPKSRAMAIQIFGENVKFVRGVKKSNYIVGENSHHAEARGIQYMLNNNIPTEGARQGISQCHLANCSIFVR